MLARSTRFLLSSSLSRPAVSPRQAPSFSLWVRSSSPSSSVSNFELNSSSSPSLRSFSSSPPSSTSKATMSTTPTPRQVVQDSLKKDYISVFSKSWCPFCTRAKSNLADLSLPPGKEIRIFELDDMDDGADVQDYLSELTGQRSVPNIFIQGKHLGGSDDLSAAMSNGRLATMLEVKAGL